MNKEVLFAKTLEQVRKTAKEQGNCISEEQVKEAFAELDLSNEQLQMVFDYLLKHKIGIGQPMDPDEFLTEEEKDYASVLANAPYHAYSGQCTYCGHCAPCPSRIDIAMVNKLYDLAVMQEEVPATVKAHYSQLSANAGDCIQCGGCETRCPFGVRIVERMEKAKALFGQA